MSLRGGASGREEAYELEEGGGGGWGEEGSAVEVHHFRRGGGLGVGAREAEERAESREQARRAALRLSSPEVLPQKPLAPWRLLMGGGACSGHCLRKTEPSTSREYGSSVRRLKACAFSFTPRAESGQHQV